MACRHTPMPNIQRKRQQPMNWSLRPCCNSEGKTNNLRNNNISCKAKRAPGFPRWWWLWWWWWWWWWWWCGLVWWLYFCVFSHCTSFALLFLVYDRLQILPNISYDHKTRWYDGLPVFSSRVLFCSFGLTKWQNKTEVRCATRLIVAGRVLTMCDISIAFSHSWQHGWSDLQIHRKGICMHL